MLIRVDSIVGHPQLFPLAAISKFTSHQREQRLRDRLQRAKDSITAEGALVKIDTTYGPLVLRCGSIVIATVLEEDRALEILMEEASKVVTETPDCLPDSLELLGVQDLGDSGITLRIQLRTGPAKHWLVGRKLNLRVKNRFDQEGIEIPFPQLALWSRREETESAPNPVDPT